MQPLWVPVGFTVKSFLFFCTHVTCYNPASKMATVPLKVTWKVSVNIALSLAFILAELNPERKFSPKIPNSLKTTGIFLTVFITHVWNHGCLRAWALRSTTAWWQQTNSFEWLRAAPLSTHLLSITAEGASTIEMMHRTCLSRVFGSHWSELTAAAMQGKHEDCFCTPQKKA